MDVSLAVWAATIGAIIGLLAIDFDGEQRVWAPVGEFFGSGPGLHPFQGWWRRVEADGWMTCWWPMP